MHANTSVLQSKLAYNDDKYTSDRLILVAQQRAIGETVAVPSDHGWPEGAAISLDSSINCDGVS